jgi:hypothetical protein
VRRGESPLDRKLAARLLRRLASEAAAGGGRGGSSPPPARGSREEGAQQEAPHPPEALTPRELEVLELVKRGHINRRIGRELGITAGMVEIHVQCSVGRRYARAALSDSWVAKCCRATPKICPKADAKGFVLY